MCLILFISLSFLFQLWLGNMVEAKEEQAFKDLEKVHVLDFNESSSRQYQAKIPLDIQ